MHYAQDLYSAIINLNCEINYLYSNLYDVQLSSVSNESFVPHSRFNQFIRYLIVCVCVCTLLVFKQM